MTTPEQSMTNKFSLNKIPTDALNETAQHLKRLRKQQRLPQAQLAVRSGVSLGSLKRFEQTGQVSFEHLLKLAHVLDGLSDFEHLLAPVEQLEPSRNQGKYHVFKEEALKASVGFKPSSVGYDFVEWMNLPAFVVLTAILALPAGWLLMRQWLSGFAYRIDLSWWIFAFAALTAAGMAFFATGSQSLRAAAGNPVDVLRGE